MEDIRSSSRGCAIVSLQRYTVAPVEVCGWNRPLPERWPAISSRMIWKALSASPDLRPPGLRNNCREPLAGQAGATGWPLLAPGTFCGFLGRDLLRLTLKKLFEPGASFRGRAVAVSSSKAGIEQLGKSVSSAPQSPTGSPQQSGLIISLSRSKPPPPAVAYQRCAGPQASAMEFSPRSSSSLHFCVNASRLEVVVAIRWAEPPTESRRPIWLHRESPPDADRASSNKGRDSGGSRLRRKAAARATLPTAPRIERLGADHRRDRHGNGDPHCLGHRRQR